MNGESGSPSSSPGIWSVKLTSSSERHQNKSYDKVTYYIIIIIIIILILILIILIIIIIIIILIIIIIIIKGDIAL